MSAKVVTNWELNDQRKTNNQSTLYLKIFSCILLSNHMIFLMQFGINNHLKFFSKFSNEWFTSNRRPTLCARDSGITRSKRCKPLEKKEILSVFEILTCTYLFQIELDVMWLPILSKWQHNIYTIIEWSWVGYEEFCRSRRVLSTKAECWGG